MVLFFFFASKKLVLYNYPFEYNYVVITYLTFRHTALLDTPAIIGIAAGGAGGVLLLTVVCLLMVCVYCCARRGHEGGKSLRVLCVKGGEGGFLLSCGDVKLTVFSPHSCDI